MVHMPDRELLVSTRNAHKVAEIRAILGEGFDVLDLSAFPAVPAVEETGVTFEDNATLKALAASHHFGGWVLADDSGLEVDALGGAPGVKSARYAGEDADDAANRHLLLRNLEAWRGRARTGRFRCVLVLARGGAKVAAFEGVVEGILAPAEKGDGGFGYDPLFIPEGECATFAQLPAATKNRLSHRGRALAALRAWEGWHKREFHLPADESVG
jgi:XTP/dITP diphosphohydrolase